MSHNRTKALQQHILEPAGIELNGSRPWDMRVHHEGFYDRVWSQGLVAFGESYMDGWWDAERLDEFFYKVNRFDQWKNIRRNWKLLLPLAAQALFNGQRKSKAFEIGERHYDVGNDLYQAMLDR